MIGPSGDAVDAADGGAFAASVVDTDLVVLYDIGTGVQD